jgi:NADH-quinone oxidoreductase subunit J
MFQMRNGTAGLILLVAMIGAIVLTHRERPDYRHQNIAKQVARRPQDATVNTRPDIGKGVQL